MITNHKSKEIKVKYLAFSDCTLTNKATIKKTKEGRQAYEIEMVKAMADDFNIKTREVMKDLWF